MPTGIKSESLKPGEDLTRTQPEIDDLSEKGALARHLRQTTNLQLKYASRTYTILTAWMSIALVVVVLDSIDPPPSCQNFACIWVKAFSVDWRVMLGIVGSTTAAVIGLVIAVIKGLFQFPRNTQAAESKRNTQLTF